MKDDDGIDDDGLPPGCIGCGGCLVWSVLLFVIFFALMWVVPLPG